MYVLDATNWYETVPNVLLPFSGLNRSSIQALSEVRVKYRTPSIPEIGQRDRFIKRAIEGRAIYAVAGEDGLARVSSQHNDEMEVTLMWSKPGEAERWADVIAANPRVKQLTIAEVLADILPALPKLNRVVGLDWNSNPIEGEFAADVVAEHLRTQAIEGFVRQVKEASEVFILEDSAGPAMMVSKQDESRQFMPVWSSRGEAEARIEGPWANMMAMNIPLTNFLALTLPWLEERQSNVCPDHASGAGTLELTPKELSARLSERVKSVA